MTTVLLLGGTGFIGHHVRAALDAHPQVERVTTVGRDRIDLMTASRDDVETLLDEVDPQVVVNCTGRLDGTSADLMAIHALATARLLDAIAGRDREVRLVRLGSAGEYGPIHHGVAVREDAPTSPVGAYGVSHRAATDLVRTAAESGLVDAVSLRVFNPVGSGAQGDSVLVRAAERIAGARAAGTSTVTMGPLHAWRDMVDVRDVADAVARVATTPMVPGPVINVGSGSAVQVRTVVRLLADVAGFDGDFVEAAAGPSRSAGVDWTCADIGVARSWLGWAPRHPLEEAVAAVWADHQARTHEHGEAPGPREVVAASSGAAAPGRTHPGGPNERGTTP